MSDPNRIGGELDECKVYNFHQKSFINGYKASKRPWKSENMT
ncbi:6294_t:CDS:2, partial [Dentiscutata heterogama]